jgi:hypothetical protein
VYTQDVVFIEMKDVVKHEVLPSKEELEKIELDLKDDKSHSTEENELEEEHHHTPVLRTYDFHLCSIFSLYTTYDNPRTVMETVDSEDEKLWKNVMDEEMEALDKNEAWDLVELPTGINPIGNKWVFKNNLNAGGKVEKYKARLVAKGYSHVEGIDFGEIFSHVPKLNSIIFMLSVVFSFDFEVE